MTPKPLAMRQIHNDYKWSHAERPAASVRDDGVPAANRRRVNLTPLGRHLHQISQGTGNSAHVAATLLRGGTDAVGFGALHDALQEEDHPLAGAYPWHQAHRHLMVDRTLRPLIRRAGQTHGYDPAYAGMEFYNDYDTYHPGLQAFSQVPGHNPDHFPYVSDPEDAMSEEYGDAVSRIAGYYEDN